ncbi:hypothetical protein PHYSODRAFT_485088 [Phytophthora sojae]|uniref:Uncharacterized protein n=1 Tax=Phytophthora sojae (strain P6497) TaxID=1094619 RepID=G4YTX6_PHYSP|nr:hypothetical protein PHYSODRAFT_485088 [Phytophthora sojae]EGZ25447.1 hypothetical protein PHYSODRAFT_485088 [Phytophthora sojae]|eukprot:XP_009520735.1 hypothetical protein PHYSODRAFT_485088 [Phytophthora sojae]
MEDAAVLAALSATALTRQRMAAALRDLRRNLHDEYIRDERDRLLRHYLTVGCLSLPVVASWMDLWRGGNDINLINMTSLSRFVASY